MPEGKSFDGLYPITGLKIVKDFRRPAPELVESFRDRFVPDIADYVGVMYCLDPSIKPAYTPMPRLLGTAFTVKVPPGDNLMVKKALHMAKPGDVIVVDARGHTEWCLGGAGMTVVAKQRGIVGMLVDGAYRDIEQLKSLEFPLFLKGVAPATGPKRGPGMINVPVHCGGVIIHPGDIIVGDSEGVVVVPRVDAEIIATKVGQKVLKNSAEDWDWEHAVEADKARDEYFDAVLAARGCKFEEFAD